MKQEIDKLEYDEDCSTFDDFFREITAPGAMTQKECDESLRPGNSGIDITRIDRKIFERISSLPIEDL